MSNQVSVSLQTLPQDIATEILLRLPLESILACKCVSKQWKNLINDPKFTKLCRNKSITLFLCKGKVYCLSKKHESSDRPSFKLCCMPFMGRQDQSLIWSSNRIACVRESNSFLLYDLLNGDSHSVTDAPFYGRHIFWFRYGFGYDGYADDHKIVVVCRNDICKRCLRSANNACKLHLSEGNRFRITLENTDCSVIFVYSFENRCWKAITGFPCATYAPNGPYGSLRKQGYSFNGALHWILVKLGLYESVIGALDLHSYSFVEIVLPTLEFGIIGNVGEFDGLLCCYAYSVRRFDVWVMKEYGVGESWTKFLSIGQSQIRNYSFNRLTPTMVYQCGDGRKLVLFWYDVDNGKIEKVVYETARGKLGILRMLKSSLKAAVSLICLVFFLKTSHWQELV